MAILPPIGAPVWRRLLALALRAALLLLPALAVLLPFWPVPWLYGAGATLLVLGWLALRQRPVLDRGLALPLALLFLWGLASSLWSPQPLEAAGLAARSLLTLLLLLLLADFCRRLPPELARQALSRALPGFLLALALLIEERLSHLGLTRLFGGGEDAVGARWDDRLNRGVFAVVLHSLAPAAALWIAGHRQLAAAPPFAALAVVLFFPSQAAVVAAAGALLFLGLGLARPALAAGLFLALGLALLLAALPVALLLGQSGLAEAGWLDITARARVQIWNFTAERILERPLFGWGLDAADVMPNFGEVSQLPWQEQIIPNHPHNGALQLWLELGLVGLLLATALFLQLWRRARRLVPPAGAFVLALWAAVLAIQSLSVGLLQSRWLALVGLALLQLLLVLRAAAACQQSPSSAANKLN